MPSARWMRRLCVAGVLLCLAVVVLGAYVRLSAAGLGCPDWPGCYGHVTPLGAERSALAQPAWANRPLVPGKAWREMIHRYAVGALGITILLITALAIVTRRRRLASVSLALALFAILLAQAILGMLTVTWQLNPLIVTLHLLFGMTTLALLWWLLLSLPRGPWDVGARRGTARALGSSAVLLTSARRLTLLGLAALAVQIALGGWTSSNYAAIACPDLPTCQGRWWPDADFRHAFVLWHGLSIDYEGGVLAPRARIGIQLTHRLWAVITAVLLAIGATFVLRRRALTGARAQAAAVLAALLLQLAIGMLMVLRGFPLALATAHTAGAALLLLATLALLRAVSTR